MSLKEVLASSTVTREQVDAARLAQKRGVLALEAAKVRARVGDIPEQKVAYLREQFELASQQRARVEREYDQPRQEFLKANRGQHQAAIEQQAKVMRQIADLERGAALDAVSIHEGNGFQKLIEDSLTKETDSGMAQHLTKSVESGRKKLASLREDQKTKQAELVQLRKQLPRLQERLDSLVADLAL